MVTGIPVKSISSLADNETARLGAVKYPGNRFSGNYLLRRSDSKKDSKIVGGSRSGVVENI
ncbi:hypothetical protein DSECCO2_358650 [anaerobic digester metagenome]